MSVRKRRTCACHTRRLAGLFDAFPFLRRLGGDDSTYAQHMKDARFTIPTPGLLAKVVDLLDEVPMQERDTKRDLYEYMIATAVGATCGVRRSGRPIADFERGSADVLGCTHVHTVHYR